MPDIEESESVNNGFMPRCRGSDLAKKIFQSKIPSREENLMLVKRAKDGDRLAMDEVIIRNGRLVFSVMKNYTYAESIEDDILQEGLMGIQHAVMKFDFGYKVSFSTYAVFWIRQKIGIYLNQNLTSVKYPRYMIYRMEKIKKMDSERADNGLPPLTDQQYAEALKISVKDVMEAKKGIQQALSIEAPLDLDDGSMTIGDLIPAECRETGIEIMEQETVQAVSLILEEYLNDRERDILRMRYGISPYLKSHSFGEIAEKYGFSKQWAERIHKRSLCKLKSAKCLHQMKKYGII